MHTKVVFLILSLLLIIIFILSVFWEGGGEFMFGGGHFEYSDSSSSSVNSRTSVTSSVRLGTNNDARDAIERFEYKIESLIEEHDDGGVSEASFKNIYPCYVDVSEYLEKLVEAFCKERTMRMYNMVSETMQKLERIDGLMTIFILKIHTKVEAIYCENTPKSFSIFEHVPILYQLLHFRNSFRDSHLIMSNPEVIKSTFVELVGRFGGIVKGVFLNEFDGFDVDLSKLGQGSILDRSNIPFLEDVFWKVAGMTSCMDVFDDNMEILMLLIKTVSVILMNYLSEDENLSLRWLNIKDEHIPKINQECLTVMLYFMEKDVLETRILLKAINVPSDILNEENIVNMNIDDDDDDDDGGGDSDNNPANNSEMIHGHTKYIRCGYVEMMRSLKPEQYGDKTVEYMEKRYLEFWDYLVEKLAKDNEFNPVMRQEMHKRVFQLVIPAGFELGRAHMHLEVHNPMTISEMSVLPKIKRLCEYLCSIDLDRAAYGMDHGEFLSPMNDKERELETQIPEFPDYMNNNNPLFKRACILIFMMFINKVMNASGFEVLGFFGEMLDMERDLEYHTRNPKPGLVIYYMGTFYFIDTRLRLINIEDQDPKRLCHLIINCWSRLSGKISEVIENHFGYYL